MEKEKNNLLTVLLTIIIMLILLIITVVIMKKNGYVTFGKNDSKCRDNTSIIDNSGNIIDFIPNIDNENNNTDNDTKNNNDNIDTNKNVVSSSNMTNDEIFDLWNKIKGNWANIEYINDLCAGGSLEINTNVKLAKFNSDGIIDYNITSFEKINDNQYKINLILPVNLNNQMIGNTKAITESITLDISKLTNNILKVVRENGTVDYEYVGENKYIVNEETHFKYIDGGFSQDYYCDWYKKNH